MIRRLLLAMRCAIFGHRYTVARVLNKRARKVACHRCGRQWAMHDPTRSFLPWDAEFESLYAPGGTLHDLYGIDPERRVKSDSSAGER